MEVLRVAKLARLSLHAVCFADDIHLATKDEVRASLLTGALAALRLWSWRRERDSGLERFRKGQLSEYLPRFFTSPAGFFALSARVAECGFRL